jgi:hypothetical protein
MGQVEQGGNPELLSEFVKSIKPTDRVEYEQLAVKIRRLFDNEDFKVILEMLEKSKIKCARAAALSGEPIEIYRQQGRYLGFDELLLQCNKILDIADGIKQQRKDKAKQKNRQDDINYE